METSIIKKTKEKLYDTMIAMIIFSLYFIISFFFKGFLVMLLWNWITPVLMWCHPISYAQALGLQFLIALLRPSSYGKGIKNIVEG